MNDYFAREQSMAYHVGNDVKPVLQTIAGRFMADNPPVPVIYHLRSRDNFHISVDYMDEIKIHEKFPNMKSESYAYAWAEFAPAEAGPFHFRFCAYGPVAIYVNGTLAYRTNHTQERFSDQISDVCLELKAGFNSLVFCCIATPLGCGFCIGSSSYKGRRIQFFGSSKEHKGMSGFIYSEPMEHPLENIPEQGCSETVTGIAWYPKTEWIGEEQEESLFKRLYGDTDREMIGATKIDCLFSGNYIITPEKEGTKIYIDGIEKKGTGSLYLSGGNHILALRGQQVGVAVRYEDGSPVMPECPILLAGDRQPAWLYLGTFGKEEEIDWTSALTFKNPVKADGTETFWRVDMPETYIRPFNEGVLYGEWSYPLGVTLYGLIQTARMLEDHAIDAYVEGHMRKCTDFYAYCLWDQETYGAAPFHNQLTTMDSLDDCGSFAMAMLEVMKDHEMPKGSAIADAVAFYIRNDQKRLTDGTFYRNDSYMQVMNETMWADDMYMSIPFLCRYYEMSKDVVYLEEAIHQVKQFYSYLLMPELEIMSHIYDTHYQVQTKVPWGRGNGWVLFSITELLAVIPKSHPERETLLTIYRKLCHGYAGLQDEDGMWHQVLTVADSYRETSCTAMFIYGFARGVRYGWLSDRAVYAKSARKGWKALCQTAIDWKGNLYGVCRGSGYSFSKEYYAHDLGWNFNDTHGTGIVLLAGIEVEKMVNVVDSCR